MKTLKNFLCFFAIFRQVCFKYHVLLLIFYLAIHQLNAQAVDSTFKTTFSNNDHLSEMGVQMNSKIIVGGRISAYNSSGINNSGQIARINSDGSFDTTFNPGTGFNGSIGAIAIQANGKILVGGNFTQYNGFNATKLIRLNEDGSIDTTFNIGAGFAHSDNDSRINNYIDVIAIGPDDKIYVGGKITNLNKDTINMIVSFNDDGSLNQNFAPTREYHGIVQAIAFQKDGKILLGGSISRLYYPDESSEVIRLNKNGSLDNEFKVSSSNLGSVNDIVVQKDNKILVGGDFTEYDSLSIRHLVRLNNDGTIDMDFNNNEGFYSSYSRGIHTGPYYHVSDIALQQDGDIVVVGTFESYNGTPLSGVVRLNEDGSLETTFDYCGGAYINRIWFYKTHVLADGQIIVAGEAKNPDYDGFKDNPSALIKFNGQFTQIPPPQAEFDFVVVGNEVSFINNSTNADTYYWTFGNGRPSTVSNPTHSYTRGGNYTVTLTVTGSGGCGTQSKITKTINIVDLQSIHPKSGGNTGAVTVNILGAGFTDKTEVKLVRGGKELKSTSTSVTDMGRVIYATFEFTDQELGIYDVMVNSGMTSAILKDGFEIEKSKDFELNGNIIGRDAIRMGRKQEYTIHLENASNIDAKGVPILLVIPNESNIEFDFSIFGPSEMDSTDLYFVTDSLFGESISLSRVYEFTIPKISANSTNKYKFSLSIDKQINPNLELYILKPLISNPAPKSSGRINTDFEDGFECLRKAIEETVDAPHDESCLEEAKKRATEKIGNSPCDTRLPGNSLEAVIGKGCEEEINKQSLGVYGPVGIMQAYEMLLCYTSTTINLINLLRNNILKEISLQKLKELRKNLKKCDGDSGGRMQECSNDMCDTPIPVDKKELALRVVTSLDPNEKIGAISNPDANHIQGTNILNYKIFFENLDSVGVEDAQEVFITDTLDTNVLDKKSFALGPISFGGKVTITPPAGLQAYATMVDLRPAVNLIVRITAKLDTASGVVSWRFLSLDPKTLELTDNPYLGFLPPNANPPQGEGLVSYSIKPKPDLAFGTQIKNKATIYFDANDPIATNTFINTIDRINPESKVTVLEPTVSDTTFLVKWSGTDQGAGIRYFNVYVKTKNGPYQIWKYNTTATEALFTGEIDSTYSFYSTANDFAGNTEGAKIQAEATTTITASPTGINDLENGFISKAYPNPFSSETTIEFEMPFSQRVTVTIRDLTGRVIVTLLKDQLYTSGRYKSVFNTSILSNGVYICEISSQQYRKAIKLVKL